MEDYEIDMETDCPKCGHGAVHWRHCSNIHCERRVHGRKRV